VDSSVGANFDEQSNIDQNTAVMAGAIVASLCCSAGFANAQCVPGLGSTSAELGTQIFQTRLAADDSWLPFSGSGLALQALELLPVGRPPATVYKF
jgi:hypothetical protein